MSPVSPETDGEWSCLIRVRTAHLIILSQRQKRMVVSLVIYRHKEHDLHRWGLIPSVCGTKGWIVSTRRHDDQYQEHVGAQAQEDAFLTGCCCCCRLWFLGLSDGRDVVPSSVDV